ncbi:MAG: hypothetical protein GX986_11570 [Firmicutes bacterium]|nr:hypothetical protein [Bacillota bacterium]
MSRIIKASFEPIMGVVNHDDGSKQQELHQQLLPPEQPKTNGQGNPAAAIVDAAAVISTAQARAADLLRQAEERAVELVVAAEEQVTALRQDAEEAGFAVGKQAGYEEGYAVGKREGAAAIQRELQADKQVMLDIIGECQALRSRAIAQAERDIVVLSLAIAEKIVRRHLEHVPEDTTHVVQEVVEGLQQSDGGVIRVHPSVLSALGESMEQTIADVDAPKGFELVGDSSIKPGGCLVETAFGRLDARLETRLTNLSQALLQSLEGECP